MLNIPFLLSRSARLVDSWTYMYHVSCTVPHTCVRQHALLLPGGHPHTITKRPSQQPDADEENRPKISNCSRGGVSPAWA
ncbi:hypothetical protein VTN00DRAFT_1626 [Thermoascus crustaceus]|uniref:uncharacterized protein n=1 Tax=Thermoascus crustaceus TaxID=5088 RepID=UPI00374320A6